MMNKGLETDSILSHYQIISKIGKGGMGEVYLAQDTKLDRRVALKILPAEFANDKDRMSRFVREAKSASALNHPNIITIHEIDEFEGTHFIATEFIDGKTLTEYAKDKSLSYKSVLDIAIQIASALDEAHRAGIVHRDIKPDNIMVRTNSLAKILDFGIAKLSENAAANVSSEDATAIQTGTVPGMIIGTPNYMSPEQARGRGVDHQTDIFSFGVVFYELLSGASPFAGDTISDVIVAVLTKEATPLENIPSELAAIVQKSLQKDKQKRYQTAQDLLDDLKEVKEELAVQSRQQRTSSPNLEEPQTQILKAVTTAATESQNSIAVLPFTNMSADEENEYFCDGLAEELLNALSKIEDLKVAARTSAFSFKGKNANVSEIGAKLSVKNILAGSVRRSGNKLRISVQLVNAAGGHQLWSERYDREMADIFDVQDEIALAVVDALKVKLFGDEKAEILKRYTDNTEAFQLYLKGRFYAGKLTPEGYRKSVECYEQALLIEPNYALALAALSITYVVAWYLGFDETARSISEANATINKALVLDGSLAEAHFALALVKFNFERNWTEAEKVFQRTIELSPDYAETYEHYGMFLAVMERADEAVTIGKRAIELAPLALKTIYIAGWAFWLAGQLDLAREQGENLLELEPNFSGGHTHLGINLWSKGAHQKSLIALETAVKLGGGNDIKMLLGLLYGIVGEREKATQLLTEFERLDEQGIFTANHQAFIYAGMGEMERAFALLEQAHERHEGVLVFLKQFSSLYPEFHNDPRMTALLNRLGLPTDKTNQTDESLEASTVMLRAGEATSDSAAKDLTTENAETKRPTQPATDAKSEIQKPKSKRWLFGMLGLIILVGGFFGFKYLTPHKQIESIAVMPFVNESGNVDVEYLGDGMTETLINSLSQIPNLSVKARSSVFRYKGKELDLKKIAAELNVQAILTGRILQRGEQLTLNLELIDARTENIIWGNTYERKSSDLVSLQSEIARDVSGKLKLKLSDADEQNITKNYTANPAAYQLYLRGKFYWNKRTGDALKQAAAFYRQAIEVDPNYALAYSGLAETYVLFSSYDVALATDSMPQAKAAAWRALEIDEQLAEAHTALGFYLANYEWDRVNSEKEYRRAIELKPNYATAHHWFGADLSNVGRFDDSILELRRAEELDPLSLIIGTNLGDMLLVARRYDEAIAQYKRTLVRNPDFAYAHQSMSRAYGAKGMFAEAIAEARRAVELNPASSPKAYLALWLARSGKRDEALKILGELKQLSTQSYVGGDSLALIYLGLGDRVETLNWLEKNMESHAETASIYSVTPEYEELRSEPRFKAMLKRMNLPE